mmetsp:Transcript_7985/g.18840  ORF Transcript_7985/g.18840 Transcript_7985/m.18840 type:complete len:233 (-) Transcript_7985:2-700(-)
MEHRPFAPTASTATQVVRRTHPPGSAARRESSPQAREAGSAGTGPPSFTLRLRAKKVVKWGEDVVDNEDMGKRKSKKCCIFHKRKKFGESSSESEGYSSTESGSESPGRQRRALCTCDETGTENESGGPAAAGPVRPGAKRGPFTQRRQDQQEPTAARPHPDPWGLDEPNLTSPSANGGAPGAPAASAAEEQQAAQIRDFLTDSAAIEQLQVENRPPQEGGGRRRSSDSGQN